MAQFRQVIDSMGVNHVAIQKATVQKLEKGKKAQRKKWNQKERRHYKDYTPEQIQGLIDLAIFCGVSVRKAAIMTGTVIRTVQNYIRQYRIKQDPRWLPGKKMGHHGGNSRGLKEEHTKFLMEFFDNNASVVLWKVCDTFSAEFPTLSIDISNIRRHMVNHYSLTLEKLNKLLAERNSPRTIEQIN